MKVNRFAYVNYGFYHLIDSTLISKIHRLDYFDISVGDRIEPSNPIAVLSNLTVSSFSGHNVRKRSTIATISAALNFVSLQN